MPCSSAPWARVSNPSPHNWGLKGLGPVMGVEVPGSWVGPEERRPAPSCFAHNPFEGQSQHCRALLGPVRVTPLGQKGSPGKGGVSRAAKDPAAEPQLPCSIARKGRACSKAKDRTGRGARAPDGQANTSQIAPGHLRAQGGKSMRCVPRAWWESPPRGVSDPWLIPTPGSKGDT